MIQNFQTEDRLYRDSTDHIGREIIPTPPKGIIHTWVFLYIKIV